RSSRTASSRPSSGTSSATWTSTPTSAPASSSPSRRAATRSRSCWATTRTGKVEATMRSAFRVTSTFLAEVALDVDRQAIIDGLVAEAERLGLGEKDYAIFDVHDLGLKAVVHFASRVIHVMTRQEYEQTTLPGSPRRP